jgi:GDPmannose 4,6-dehydratase
MKRALITGITGQDGAYLAQFLLNKGYDVYAIYRRSSTPNFWRLQTLGILNKIKMIPADMADMGALMEAVKIADPEEIYNLAAQSYVGASFDQPLFTAEIDGIGVAKLLEVVRNFNKDIKIYQASTSELYGGVKKMPQDEKTVFIPNSPYAAAKLYSYHMLRIYREGYNMFTCNGILFNHESPLRGLEFVTRKITNAAVRIKLGLQKDLELGNLDPKRDWGFAPDYVRCMWMMLQQDKPDDYVVATGETHTVQEFVENAFSILKLNWKDYVKINKMFVRPVDVFHLYGNPAKAKKELGWKPRVKFNELVKIMVKADLDRWKKYLKGETLYWDAPNYPHDINIYKRSLDR